MKIRGIKKLPIVFLFIFLTISSFLITSAVSAQVVPKSQPNCIWKAFLDPKLKCGGSLPVQGEEINCDINTKPQGITAVCCCPAPYQAKAEANEQAGYSEAAKNFSSLKFTPQLTIPGSKFIANQSMDVGTIRLHDDQGATNIYMRSDLMALYIKALYKYGLSIAGILAAIILMAGGITWLISGGSPNKITQAKELIGGSLVGLVILLSSYILLKTINPELVNPRAISTKIIQQMTNTTCCSPQEGEEKIMTTLKNGKRVFADGDNKDKPFTCSSGYFECDNKKQEVCLRDTNNVFACQIDNVCCECGTGLTFGGLTGGIHKKCQEHMRVQDCYDWCDTLTGTLTGYQTWTYSNSDSHLTCQDGRTIYNLGNFGITYDVCGNKQ